MEIAGNCWKWMKMVEMDENGWNGWNLLELAGLARNGWDLLTGLKWLKMPGNGRTWLETA